jgi:hypothetical protein
MEVTTYKVGDGLKKKKTKQKNKQNQQQNWGLEAPWCNASPKLS